ncbi:MAG: AbrB/MazE/SpoVT family DNA-binding domain-containing protein [Caulobacteraceae bacterium]|nr:AbrB/MazE/SpoVT family DNA-binding domain-containing protein [Caulobacteraceae bacterium]
MAEAKLFKVGGSQAVRLPKEFRMPGDSVRIRREGDAVILEPLPAKPGRTVEEVRAWLAGIQALAKEDAFERPEQPPQQERDWSLFD